MRLIFAILMSVIVLAAAGCTTDDLVPKAPVGKQTKASPIEDNAVAADPGQPVEASVDDSMPPQNTLQAQAAALEGKGLETTQPTVKVATVATSGTIRFMPIIGAPVQAVTPLSRQLGTDARAKGLVIRSSSDTSAEHILKGYLSAFNDGQKTTIVYVWDVLDNSGQRLNRIQGQEEVAGAASDAWANVPAATMQAIASKTISQYLAWKGRA